jgi:hypothetical protein
VRRHIRMRTPAGDPVGEPLPRVGVRLHASPAASLVEGVLQCLVGVVVATDLVIAVPAVLGHEATPLLRRRLVP